MDKLDPRQKKILQRVWQKLVFEAGHDPEKARGMAEEVFRQMFMEEGDRWIPRKHVFLKTGLVVRNKYWSDVG